MYIKILRERDGTEEQKFACIALNKRLSGNKKQLYEAGALNALVHGLRTGGPITRDVAATSLCMFAMEKEFREILISIYSFHTIATDLITSASTSDTTRGNVLGAILNLANEEANRETMCTPELILALLFVFASETPAEAKDFPQVAFSAKHKDHASGAIWGISKAPRNQFKLVGEKFFLPALLSTICSPPAASSAAEYSLRCLKQLCQSDSVRSAMSSDVIVVAVVVACLASVTPDSLPTPLAIIATETAYEMAKTKPTKRRLVAESNLTSVLAGMLSPPPEGDPPQWWQFVCGALYELAGDPAGASAFSNSENITETLFSVLERCVNRESQRSVVQFVCGALYYMSTLTPGPHAIHAKLASNQSMTLLLSVISTPFSLDPSRMFVSGIFIATMPTLGFSNDNLVVRDAGSLIRETQILEDILEGIDQAGDKLRMNLSSAMQKLLSSESGQKGFVEKVTPQHSDAVCVCV